MRGKLICVILIFCMMLTVGGCSSESKGKQVSPKTKVVETKDLDKYEVKNITTFETENAYEVLKDSKALPHSENITFRPLVINDKSEVFGESIKQDESVALLMLDAETGIYKELFVAEKGTTIGVSNANDNYVFFSVVNQEKGTVSYYCMNFNNLTNNTIYESQYLNGVAVPTIAMVDQIAYISLPIPDDTRTYGIKYSLVRYDMTNNKQEVIVEKETIAYPVYFKNNLYYLDIDNDNLTTDLVKYDLQTKKSTILAKGNKQDGYFSNLISDGETLIVQVSYGIGMENFCKVEVDPFKITPYFTIRGVDSFSGANGYFSWSGPQESDTQMHKTISFFDFNKQIVYKYKDSLIYFSKKGILWVKYAIEENKIPKLKIFTKDYSVLMWCPYHS